jgi:RNA polymerase sigma-70 factor (ECF subfamily)
MNRAIALAEVRGPQTALEILDDLDLDEYHLFHASRAELLRRLGRHEDASRAYALAANLAASDAERSFLLDRAETAQSDGTGGHRRGIASTDRADR